MSALNRIVGEARRLLHTRSAGGSPAGGRSHSGRRPVARRGRGNELATITRALRRLTSGRGRPRRF
ncbi:hypothetical protein HDA32_001440 [Spinactinospora alkalitolerans]|uniref:Uncharacterized protein n=1 Tax=Spinactinospora alkalitolerans TaxID=687207 RepID=A0A852TWT5_9ACTN|nr:hypothetical protein [Spinactinospora alkalitolerans]